MSMVFQNNVAFVFYVGWREISACHRAKLGNEVTPQALFLLRCCSLDKGITMKDLSQCMVLNSSAVSTLVKRLEKKKWLTRQHDVVDRRQVYVSLTQDGEAVLKDYHSRMDEVSRCLKALLSDEQQRVLQHVVDQFVANHLNAC